MKFMLVDQAGSAMTAMNAIQHAIKQSADFFCIPPTLFVYCILWNKTPCYATRHVLEKYSMILCAFLWFSVRPFLVAVSGTAEMKWQAVRGDGSSLIDGLPSVSLSDVSSSLSLWFGECCLSEQWCRWGRFQEISQSKWDNAKRSVLSGTVTSLDKIRMQLTTLLGSDTKQQLKACL